MHYKLWVKMFNSGVTELCQK